MQMELREKSTDAVILHSVSKTFPGETRPALQPLDATLSKGKLIGLVGPDGAGKTTLLRLIGGLFAPTQGNIEVFGLETITSADEARLNIGYMPQKFGLYEDLTVMQNFNFFADLQGVVGPDREERIKRLLHFTDLGIFTERLAGALSGGMKQKLGLACALLPRPKLLLLDEPSVGVDALSRRELWEMTTELLQEGLTIVWSTAYLDEAERCEEVLLLSEGALLFKGNPKELLKRVEGRTCLLTGVGENRRKVLSLALRNPDIVDGVIQGSAVRLVFKTKEIKADLPAWHAEKGQLVKTPPRFEDAFIDILGGGPKGPSLLAEQLPPLKIEREMMVEVHHLTKRFGNFTAVNDISFSVKKGEIFGLLGPNGAGKSTTFKMMNGLLKPTQGEAFVSGHSLFAAPSTARKQLGYMAQKFSMYGDLSVLQNLNFFSGIYEIQGKERKRAIQSTIEAFALEPYLNTSSGELPLGFKQRLALGCAMIHHPPILFLDEPTSGVDPITRREFWNHINGLVEKGITIIVTTHFLDEAEYCDRIALIYRGKMITMGSPDELKASVQTESRPSPTLEDAYIALIEKERKLAKEQ